jgi:hypothetical protein
METGMEIRKQIINLNVKLEMKLELNLQRVCCTEY